VDQQRFDVLIRQLTGNPESRRGALRFAGAALAGLLTVASTGQQAAACKQEGKGKRCTGRNQCCSQGKGPAR